LVVVKEEGGGGGDEKRRGRTLREGETSTTHATHIRETGWQRKTNAAATTATKEKMLLMRRQVYTSIRRAARSFAFWLGKNNHRGVKRTLTFA
jgi:hypothetical protein